jgi:hypothetical protein
MPVVAWMVAMRVGQVAGTMGALRGVATPEVVVRGAAVQEDLPVAVRAVVVQEAVMAAVKGAALQEMAMALREAVVPKGVAEAAKGKHSNRSWVRRMIRVHCMGNRDRCSCMSSRTMRTQPPSTRAGTRQSRAAARRSSVA